MGFRSLKNYAEGRTGTARQPTAALHCRLALALVASFFVLTIPLAPNAGAEESGVFIVYQRGLVKLIGERLRPPGFRAAGGQVQALKPG